MLLIYKAAPFSEERLSDTTKHYSDSKKRKKGKICEFLLKSRKSPSTELSGTLKSWSQPLSCI